MAILTRASWLRAAISAAAFLGVSFLLPTRSWAIPAFARKYNVKCYACHTIPPALNKNGYMFKRLGYRMPPDEMDGTKPAPKISQLDPENKFNLANAFAIIGQTSFTVDKQKGDNPTSNSSFNMDEAALFSAGVIPETNFSYLVHFELYHDGQSFLEQAVAAYTGGRANSSYFAKAGEMHVQEGEGTRAAMFYNLFPDPAPLLTAVDPINFTLDQHPVGINFGYTWASPYFKQILAVSGKVTNGLNADGSEILTASTKNAKDVWFDADYWFGPDGGVTFTTYYGSKDQVQQAGTPDEFTYRPKIHRYGVFGNYLFFDKLDVLGGYLHASDDWLDMLGGPSTKFTSNGFRGEVDYYLKPGFAIMARYDRMNQKIGGYTPAHTSAWGIGSEKALTSLGNVVLRATYNQMQIGDPVSSSTMTDKLLKIDLRLMW